MNDEMQALSESDLTALGLPLTDIQSLAALARKEDAAQAKTAAPITDIELSGEQPIKILRRLNHSLFQTTHLKRSM